jgi:hypothetical protein
MWMFGAFSSEKIRRREGVNPKTWFKNFRMWMTTLKIVFTF